MQRYANIAGILGAALFGFGLVTYLFTGLLSLYSASHMLVGLLGVGYFVVTNLRRLGDMATGRAMRTASQTVVTGAFVLVAVVALNLILTLYPKQYDWTADQVHSLSPQTERILGSLQAPVQALFFQQGGMAPEAEDLLRRYHVVQTQFDYEIVDPDQRPALAERYEIRQNGTLVLESGGRWQKVQELDEAALTNGLIELFAGRETTIGFLTGHGERSIEDDVEAGGLGVFKLLLEEQNYRTAPVDLAESGGVPAGIDVLVVAAPTQALFANEISAIEAFVQTGGDVLVLADPFRSGAFGLMRTLGVEPAENIVLDEMMTFTGPALGTQLLLRDYGEHAVMDGFASRTLFEEACSLALPAGGPPTWTPLIHSSDTSWAETDLGRLLESEEAERDPSDQDGPVVVAAAFEGYPGAATPTAGEQIVGGAALCDSDFMSNRGLGQLGNADFALNLVAWMAGESEQIAIRPRTRGRSTVFMSQDEMVNIFYATVLIFPEALLLMGLFVWWQRRQRP